MSYPTMTVRRLLCLVLLSLVPTLMAGAPAQALVVGVADQTPNMFSDARFLALNLHDARLSVPWDVLGDRGRARSVDQWLRAARTDGVSPLISFDHSYVRSRFHRLPSAAAFGRAFRIFRARYPWVRAFATWNEANYCGEPTCHRPALVAAYYRVLRRGCPRCDILASELLDEPNMLGWVRSFDHALGGQAGIWGLHNYIGANRLQTASTVSLLRAVTGQIWFTETGGLVARHNHSATDFPENPAHAALVTRFIFSRLARLSRRIARVYIYEWQAGPGRRQAWDSGLVGPGPSYRARPAFLAFVRALSRVAAHPPPSVISLVLNLHASALVGGLYGRAGPGPGLAGARRAGSVTVLDPASGRVVLMRPVAAGHDFVVALRPGTYTLTGAIGKAAGCALIPVRVLQGASLVANLSCATTS